MYLTQKHGILFNNIGLLGECETGAPERGSFFLGVRGLVLGFRDYTYTFNEINLLVQQRPLPADAVRQASPKFQITKSKAFSITPLGICSLVSPLAGEI